MRFVKGVCMKDVIWLSKATFRELKMYYEWIVASIEARLHRRRKL